MLFRSEKFHNFGTTSKGVDWKDEASQRLRFIQLARLFDDVETGTLLDFGCGYGAFHEYLNVQKPDMRYHGYDISAEMLQAAASHYHRLGKYVWLSHLRETDKFDYLIASGVFNVRLEHDDAEWTQYIEDTLASFDRLTTRGFAFNMLTTYSDIEKRAAHLYFADPARYFSLCKQKYAPYVTLIHDYPLYEFTLLVKKKLP